ncbi:MAG: DUF1287 domain-containing protein [Hyphomicrobiales bacterium]|nr:DUF1287 domain-containing protein [Hyphomicrobiales bacterium]MCP5000229.1 DUF1287 domain-containing protein [Hyphomicrobiales bacterium]
MQGGQDLSKRLFALVAVIALGITAFAVLPGHNRAIGWQLATSSFASPPSPVEAPIQPSTDWSKTLIAAAEQQIGETVTYDPAYVRLAFPGGDVPRARGVCTDVVIRAMRDAHDVDLQLLVNRDMKQSFGAYPRKWGLARPDANIDHRRVPNLQRYFERIGAEQPITDDAQDYLPGDIVTWKLPGNLDHIGIVTDRPNRDATHPLVVQNIGAGTRLQDMLFSYAISGHYRLEQSDKLRSR